MFKNFIKIYKKVGGTEILKQYMKAGVLGFALFQSLLLGFSKKSLEILRLAVRNKIYKKLKKKYRKFIDNFDGDTIDTLPHERSNKVWICWWQGMESAPELVKVCFESVKKHMADREIILITADNYTDYVELPDYIVDKFNRGIISHAHFSDLLRLELLIKYGGLWIDATVLVTSDNIPDYITDSELFLFQNLKPGLDGHVTAISNWLISAYSNNKILTLTRDLLYEHWKRNNKLVDYFIFHDFFTMAGEKYSSDLERMVKSPNSTPHILLLDLMKPYNEYQYKAIKSQTCIHKLSYKFEKDLLDKSGTYYDIIIKQKGY